MYTGFGGADGKGEDDSESEGIALKDIFAVGLNMAIGSYEQKYGEIKVRKAKRGNASEVFGMED